MKQTIYILAILILTSCQMRNTWECEGDCYNGVGTKKWNDGGIERGTWKNGELIGQGYEFFGKTSKFAGDSYEGEFLGKFHGYGKYIDFSENVTYVGHWKNGKFDGKGILNYGPFSDYPNRYYEGEWKNGKRHGYGINFWGNTDGQTNNKYTGEWKNDEIDGFGRYEWPNEGTYIGPWKNGKQNGEGIYLLSNGDTIKSWWFDGYCKDLAILKTGMDVSYFKTQIVEITILSSEINQRFIDKTSRELNQTNKNPSYQIDFVSLRKLLDSALISQKSILPKLEKIKEFDNKITYKQDYLEFQYALLGVLKAFDTWINLALNIADNDLIKKSYDSINEKHTIMKKKQIKFEKTKKELNKKY